MFVAVGERGAVYTSRDGSIWNPGSSGTEHWLFDAEYGNGTFVAVGAHGTVLTSSNGGTWTLRDPGTSSHLQGVAYGGNTFVAVGDGGAILTSSDGTAWAIRESGTHQVLKKVAYGRNTFVAVGWHGTILTSSTGADWKAEAPPTSGHLESIAYGNGIFVAVGDTILASPDGIAWNESGPRTNHRFRGVAYGSGTFVAVGDGGAIFTSRDGEGWTPEDSGVRLSLSAVAYADGSFVVAAEDGTILRAPSSPSPRISVSPPSMDFGSINVGFSSINTLTILNSGSAGLNINRMAISGVNVTDFITQNDQCTGRAIAVSTSCTVQVVFSPHALGSKTAALSIYSNDPSTPTAGVQLSGSSSGVTPHTDHDNGSYCFISFLADGSGFEKIMDVFREFRDSFLLKSEAGRGLAEIYYERSPSLILFFARHSSWREIAREGLVVPGAIAWVALHTSSGEKAILLLSMIGMLAGWVIYRNGRGQIPVLKHEIRNKSKLKRSHPKHPLRASFG